jgi:hypothetical protein
MHHIDAVHPANLFDPRALHGVLPPGDVNRMNGDAGGFERAHQRMVVHTGVEDRRYTWLVSRALEPRGEAEDDPLKSPDRRRCGYV